MFQNRKIDLATRGGQVGMRTNPGPQIEAAAGFFEEKRHVTRNGSARFGTVVYPPECRSSLSNAAAYSSHERAAFWTAAPGMKYPTMPLAAVATVATRTMPGLRYYPKLDQLAVLAPCQYLMKSN
jgi:hypothetical protein